MDLENITLGQAFIYITCAITVISTLKNAWTIGKKGQSAILKPAMDKIEELTKEKDKTTSALKNIDNNLEKINENILETHTKLEETNQHIKNSNLEYCKNFLINAFSQVEEAAASNREVPAYLKRRIYDEFEHYTKLGGNSYVKSEFDALKERKLI